MYTFDGRIRYSEVDENGDLELVSLINYLQDCSTFQSESMGLGMQFMRDRHFTWVLIATRIEIARLPHFTDEIRASTWCNQMDRRTAHRCFAIERKGEGQLVRATSLWCTIDTDRLRMITIPESEHAYLEDTPDPEMAGPLVRKLRPEGEPIPTERVVVARHHLDTNHHVNNAQYVLMAQDALTEAGLGVAPADIACIQTWFRRQAVLDDVIRPKVYDEGPTTRCVSLEDEAGEAYSITRFTRRA